MEPKLTEAPRPFTPCSTLVARFPEGWRRRILTKSLTAYRDASRKSKWQQALRSEIQRALPEIPGFRRTHTDRAPLGKLLEAVDSVWQDDDNLAAAILAVWVEAQPELVRDIRACLREAGLDVAPPALPHLKAGVFTQFWESDGEVMARVEEFADGKPEADRDAILLATLLLSGRVPVSPVDYQEYLANGARSTADVEAEPAAAPPVTTSAPESPPQEDEGAQLEGPWGTILAEVASFPPEAAQWDTVDAFVAQVTALAAQKRQARDDLLARGALSDALAALAQTHEAYLSFFGIAELDALPARATTANAEGLLALVATLDDLLTRYGELDRAHQAAANVAERRAKRAELESLEARITEIHTALMAAEVPADAGGATAGGRDIPDEDWGPEADETDAPPDEGSTGVVLLPTVTFAGTAAREPHVEPTVVPEPEASAIPDEPDTQVDEREGAGAPAAEVTPVDERQVLEETVVEVEETPENTRQAEFTLEIPCDPSTALPAEPESDVDEPEDAEPTLEAYPPDIPDAMEPPPPDTWGLLPFEPPTEVEEEEAPVEPGPPPVELDTSFSRPEPSEVDWASHRAATQIVESLLGGDLSAAYWLTVAQERAGVAPVFPGWLLLALQGARWSAQLWPERNASMVQDLAAIPRAHLSFDSDADQWVAAAAALHLALVNPVGGWADWLNFETPLSPALNALMVAIRTFAAQAWPLQPAEVQGILGKAERRKLVQDASQEATEWLQQAPNRTPPYSRAIAVWGQMVRPPDGELYRWYRNVAEDRRERVRVVEGALENWMSQSWVYGEVQRIDHVIVGRKLQPIVGAAMRQIARMVEEGCAIAQRWCDAVTVMDRFAGSKGSWRQSQVTDLLQAIDRLAIAAAEELEQACDQFEARGRIASALLCDALRKTHGLLIDKISTAPAGPPVLDHGTLVHGDLATNVARRFLWVPGARLTDDGLPEEDALQENGCRLLDTLDRGQQDLDSVAQGWLDVKDYRFIGLLPALEDAQSSWTARHQQAFAADIERLRQSTDRAIVAVERALADGLIAESERSRFEGDLEAVRKNMRRAGTDPDVALDIGSLLLRLATTRQELAAIRQDRLGKMREHWEELQPQVQTLGKERGTEVSTVIDKAFIREDLRAVNEYLGHLQSALASGSSLHFPEDLFTTTEPSRTALDDLRERFNDVHQVLRNVPLNQIARDVRDDRPLPGLSFPHLPAPRRGEAYAALEAWRRLKREHEPRHDEPPLRIDDKLSLVATLMQYLGFVVAPNSPVSVAPVSAAQNYFERWRVRAEVPVDQMPVPQFGSQRGGRYDVVGVWTRPGFDAIGSLLQELGGDPVLLLYFGRMTERAWGDYLRLSRQRHLKAILIDEALILFLARQYNVRLTPLMECTLPYTEVNPYVPFVAGSVPPEVFMGRESLVNRLLDPYGPAIVYGGRQLGKSAILRQVHRQFHRPEEGQFAVLEDIRSIGDPRSGLEFRQTFWQTIAGALEREHVLRSRTVRPDRLKSDLQQTINENHLRVMLLLDEADHLLEADAGTNFEIIGSLKALMDATERRFKVVVAGLHNVQRYKNIPDQPLAHMGTPIEVGPLDPKSARQLLEKPLRALGFRFGPADGGDDGSLPLHILSYTNYHPGLIQLFGSHLVEHLQKKHLTGNPPFTVTRDDVEEVYRNRDLRQAIRDRFVWTLALDGRYEAIALSLILDQWEAYNGFDQLYTSQELLHMAASWWPSGFGSDVEQARFQGLLEEMRGLGVLSLGQGERFRLRSPNLVHLLGTHDELWGRLQEISESSPPTPLKYDSHHALLDLEENRYSPLTYYQEGLLSAARSGVGLVFGSPAAGLGDLREATRRFVKDISASNPSDQWDEAKVYAQTGPALQQWLDTNVAHRDFGRMVVYRSLEGRPEDMLSQVQKGLQFCRRYSSSVVRMIFVLDPIASWSWFQIPRPEREEIEQRVDALVTLMPWDIIGVQQRLESHAPEIIASQRTCQRTYNVTGGWPLLLDQLLANLGGGDFSEQIRVFETVLNKRGSGIEQLFIEALQIPNDNLRQIVTEFMKEEEGILLEWAYDIVSENLPAAYSREQLDTAMAYLQRTCILRRRLDEREIWLTVDPLIRRLWQYE